MKMPSVNIPTAVLLAALAVSATSVAVLITFPGNPVVLKIEPASRVSQLSQVVGHNDNNAARY